MKNNHKDILLWTARVISIVFALFISIFAMDVFEEGNGFWKTALALLMHLIPTFILILIIILTWRNNLLAGMLFSILGIAYIIFAWGKFDWTAYALIAGPLFIAGILYFLDWVQKKQQLTN
jgi:hypothetical protein